MPLSAPTPLGQSASSRRIEVTRVIRVFAGRIVKSASLALGAAAIARPLCLSRVAQHGAFLLRAITSGRILAGVTSSLKTIAVAT